MLEILQILLHSLYKLMYHKSQKKKKKKKKRFECLFIIFLNQPITFVVMLVVKEMQ